MLRKGVIPIPPAIKASFFFLSRGSVKSPASWPANALCPFFNSIKFFLKLDGGRLNFTPSFISCSVGEEAIVKYLLTPRLSGRSCGSVHSRYCPGAKDIFLSVLKTNSKISFAISFLFFSVRNIFFLNPTIYENVFPAININSGGATLKKRPIKTP